MRTRGDHGIPARTTPLLSPFQSRPPLASLIACSTSSVTLPLLTLGINPFGPNVLASVGFLWNNENISVVVMSLSGLSSPLRILSINSSPPTTSAPAARAACAVWPEAKTTRREDLVDEAQEWGRKTRPRRALSWIVAEGLVMMLIS